MPSFFFLFFHLFFPVSSFFSTFHRPLVKFAYGAQNRFYLHKNKSFFTFVAAYVRYWIKVLIPRNSNFTDMCMYRQDQVKMSLTHLKLVSLAYLEPRTYKKWCFFGAPLWYVRCLTKSISTVVGCQKPWRMSAKFNLLQLARVSEAAWTWNREI